MRFALALILFVWASIVFASDSEQLRLRGKQFATDGVYHQAMESYLQAIEVCKTEGNDSLLGNVYYHIGSLLFKQGNHQRALEHYSSGIKVHEQGEQWADLGAGYTLKGAAFRKLGILDSALHFHQKSVRINRQTGDKKLLANALNNLCAVYGNLGHRDVALSGYRESLHLKEELLDSAGQVSTLINIGKLFKDQGSFDSAFFYQHKALMLSESVSDLHIKAWVQSNLSELYRENGDYKSALEFHERYFLLKDSLQSESLQGKILEIETKYKTREKEFEIERLKQQRHLYIVYGGSGVLLLILTLLSYIRGIRIRENVRKQTARELLDLVGGTFSTAKRFLEHVKPDPKDESGVQLYWDTRSALKEGIEQLREMTNRVLEPLSKRREDENDHR